MLFKSKLRKILKNEIHSLIAFSFILILGKSLICWYIIESIFFHYNPTLIWNLLGIFIVYFIFGVIGYKKAKIIKKLKWSLLNFEDFPHEVHNILKNRKATLKSSNGYISLYSLYDEALQLFHHSELKKCA
ncbi:hypothetical protein KHQ81_02555 [Mycoplasmatota bacterium]|nr:hypothetical protein KHQ81_02555 [Mycoplasmatota bacterium]